MACRCVSQHRSHADQRRTCHTPCSCANGLQASVINDQDAQYRIGNMRHCQVRVQVPHNLSYIASFYEDGRSVPLTSNPTLVEVFSLYRTLADQGFSDKT